jgi:hypothetical protein
MLYTLSLAGHGPVIPVIVLQRVEHAVPLAEALVAGGVRVLEVTLRTPVALLAIEAIARAGGAAGRARCRHVAHGARHPGCARRRLRVRRQPGLHARHQRRVSRCRPAAAARWPPPAK